MKLIKLLSLDSGKHDYRLNFNLSANCTPQNIRPCDVSQFFRGKKLYDQLSLKKTGFQQNANLITWLFMKEIFMPSFPNVFVQRMSQD